MIILISVCTSPLVHCLGLWFRNGQAPVRAENNRFVPFSEHNAQSVDFGSREVVFAKKTKLRQNFWCRGWLHISLGLFKPGFI
jgi:hypothetical protein